MEMLVDLQLLLFGLAQLDMTEEARLQVILQFLSDMHTADQMERAYCKLK